MINEWSVEGFKSIRGNTTLPLRKITIFAGANSGGKSTFLQSILLLKQTLQYGAPNRPLALNGPIMRLGTMDDVICATATQRSIRVGFRLDTAINSITPDAPWMSILQRASFRAVEQGAVSGITGDFSWGQRDSTKESAADKLQATLKSGHLSVQKMATETGDSHRYFCDYSLPTNMSKGEIFSVSLDPLSESEVYDERPDANLKSVHTSHFLPSWVEVQFNETKQRARNITAALFSTRRLLSRPANASYIYDLVPNVALDLINDWLESRGFNKIDTDPSPSISDVADLLQQFIPRRARVGARSFEHNDGESKATLIEIQELQDSIENALGSEGRQEIGSDVEMPRNIQQGAEFLKSYFKLGIRYLGPLRDEPRPVYPLEIVENPTDVGYRGEHTAAVLELNANRHVRYQPSAYFDPDRKVGAARYGKLIDAVRDWLAYLGVAEDVVAHEQGVFGNRLQVTTSGLGKWHDLTNVGVGVSQVLPIVVSALLAPPTSLLIFEQPELHLHPRVQARLADFFLSLTAIGKQCVVETHSEYMIERLRLRVAQSENDIQDDLAIYFAERRGGETSYRSVPISRYGAVIDWPEEFFDQSQVETSKILDAAAKKRAVHRAAVKGGSEQ